jgi:protein Mpv17
MIAPRCVALGLLSLTIAVTGAYSPLLASRALPYAAGSNNRQIWRVLRGGEQEDPADAGMEEEQEERVLHLAVEKEKVDPPQSPTKKLSSPKFAMITTSLASFGKIYSQQLEQRPIATKSVTAGLIFGLSDYLAQRIERTEKKEKLNLTRMLASTLVGLLYFGPAAHYWYEMIFNLLPGTGLVSTLQKAFWGQAVFGPSFTCIFFAVGLLQSGTFSFGSWWAKIRSDLPGAWLAGTGFWPLVDIISFSVVPIKWIPLFINFCSLIWTIYLSTVSNRSTKKST